MNCQRCNSDRILSLNAKCSDCCSIFFQDKQNHGYVPSDLNIGGGDYLEFKVCLNCGQIQGGFPVSQKDVDLVFGE